jgi:hypothetical protein
VHHRLTAVKGMRAFAALAAVLAVTVGCGAAHSSAATSAESSPATPGLSTGQPIPATPIPTSPARMRWLPVLRGRQLAADDLLPRNWTLIRLTHGGTVAEIRYHIGGCLPQPKGVLVSQSRTAVMLSLEAPRPSVAADCAPVLAAARAQVHIPALAGRTLRHAPPTG